mmetsp:Transcript_19630/g.26393  ORF Transcript_19630/g.26393 Transcript_19630/m.26393 type:complete len:284 (-) Transcript_19630:87-938(-)
MCVCARISRQAGHTAHPCKWKASSRNNIANCGLSILLHLLHDLLGANGKLLRNLLDANCQLLRDLLDAARNPANELCLGGEVLELDKLLRANQLPFIPQATTDEWPGFIEDLVLDCLVHPSHIVRSLVVFLELQVRLHRGLHVIVIHHKDVHKRTLQVFAEFLPLGTLHGLLHQTVFQRPDHHAVREKRTRFPQGRAIRPILVVGHEEEGLVKLLPDSFHYSTTPCHADRDLRPEPLGNLLDSEIFNILKRHMPCRPPAAHCSRCEQESTEGNGRRAQGRSPT